MQPNRHFRYKRPPWWPANETWPPAPGHNMRLRGKFFRRMGCLFALFTIGMCAAVALAASLLAQFIGGRHLPLKPAESLLIILFWGIIVGLVLVAGRGLRRISAPVGDLLEASARVADGDYTARVEERGLPEVRSLARAFNEMASRLQITQEQRRSLLADVTHELRIPLTVIQGNLEGMIDGVYAPDEARLKSILDETRLLARLVDDLRTLTLAESGALELRKEPTDLALLIGATVDAFRAQASAAGVTLEMHAAEDAPLFNLDPARLREVFSNLITNALRYTASGGQVQVNFQMSNSSERQGIILVEDNGSGIRPEDLPHIFDRFYKARDSGGMGLGLSIARHLIEAHGGTIEAASEPGKGTTMRVTLTAG